MNEIPANKVITVTRDKTIDGLRGLACISVLFIHAAFYSGHQYVPSYISGPSLLIDVPLFFYISGRSISLSNGNSLGFSGIWRLLKIYYLLLVPLWIAQSIYLRHLDYRHLVDWVLQDYVDSKPFVAFMGSMWFIRCYCVCSPIARCLKKSHRTMLVCWIATVSALVLFGIPHDVVLTQVHFDLLHLQGIGGILWECIFYISFVFLGALHERKSLATWIWIISIALAAYTLGSRRFSDDAWIGGLQANKFPPNLFYWSYSVISISLILLSARYVSAFRRLLSSSFVQWMGKHALYAYFAQGFSSSLLYVFVQYSNHMLLGVRLLVAFLLNLSIDVSLVWISTKVSCHLHESVRRVFPSTHSTTTRASRLRAVIDFREGLRRTVGWCRSAGNGN